MTWEEIISRPMTREEAIKQLKEFIILHQEQHGWDVSTIKALEKAVKALEQNAKYRKEAKRWKNKALGQKQVLDKIRVEIEKQQKWLMYAGCFDYNVDIAFDAIKSAVAESEEVNDSN